MSADVIIEIKNMGFSYGERQILKGVSFAAGRGELIALLGPNGVGKSTFMRCLLGFLKGYTGSALIDGREAAEYSRPELAKRLAYIPQSSVPVYNYTVRDTVLMGVTGSLGMFGSPDRRHAERAEELLDRLGILRLADRGISEISGGERQLAMLARAMIQDARILIMDEPTANLDFGNQNRVMEQIAELTEDGYTAVISTHDPNQAFMYATRAAAMLDGSIIADGVPRDVLTETALSGLYGIPVIRRTIEDASGVMTVCAARR